MCEFGNVEMRLLQPSALGRANVAGRVSDGARQSVGIRECVNVGNRLLFFVMVNGLLIKLAGRDQRSGRMING